MFVYRHEKYAHLNTAVTTSPAAKGKKKTDDNASVQHVWNADQYTSWLSVCSGGALSATYCQSWLEMTESLVVTMDQLFPDVLPVVPVIPAASARRPPSSHTVTEDDEEEDDEEFEHEEDDDYDD